MNPCYFGTDIDSRDKLIACKHSIEEICQIIGADSLGYLSCESARKLADNSHGFCTACFDGNYPWSRPLAAPRTSTSARSRRLKHEKRQ